MANAVGNVTCLGLGQMGSALARCYMRNGHNVTVWNRDAEKRKAFEGSATVAPSPAEAIAASDLIVISVSTYADATSFLNAPEVLEAARGKTLVQLSSGSAPDARAGEDWAASHGIKYLDGCVLGYPSDVDADRCVYFFSGPQALYDRHAPVIETMSPAVKFVGEPVGCAKALDSALLEVFYATFLGAAHAAAICQTEGVAHDHLFEGLVGILPWIGSTAELTNRQIAARDYTGLQATNDVHVGAQEHIVTVARDNGLDTAVPEFILERYKTAVAQGHGGEEIGALYEIFRKNT
jgi:3-hydroxyisobutyrate dehydrogenase-like beta-hydroxyacid dehydrogenase